MPRLILVRHGKSVWNSTGQWTGQTDVELAPEGYEEARAAGQALKDLNIHKAHVSALTRAKQTLMGIIQEIENLDLPVSEHHALNERHYGVHTGKNKWQVKDEVGEEEFQRIRRGWDTPIAEGETLKDVYARVVPYFETEIKQDLMAGKNVLVVAHGNSLRALAKHLENLDENQVCELEIGTGEVHCYQFTEDGELLNKEIRITNSQKSKI